MESESVHIILGSQSPRRRELMKGIDLPFTAINIDADETFPDSLQGGEIPMYISRAKARAYAISMQPNDLLITADTIVWVEGQMLGKPHNADEAKAMLRLLSNRTHQVFTGVTFLYKGQYDTFVDETKVTFKKLSEEEIEYYVRTYQPFDKAGAYGVQEYIGYIGVSHMEGSYFNVMGFPIHRVYEKLQSLLRIQNEGTL